MNDRSTEALLARRALAEKATPGPWEQKVKNSKIGENPPFFVCVMLGSIEVTVAVYYPDKAGKVGGIPAKNLKAANAAHIAANSPDVVMADIDEILRLRAENARLEREADWLAEQFQDCPDENSPDTYWHICKGEDCLGAGEDTAACWRRAARAAVEKKG